MLKTIARDLTLTERAQQQLEDLIVERALRAGDRLPSEKEMGNMLGVSRTVVREAIRLLVAKGLVEVRTGSGIYVRNLDADVIRQPMNLLLRSRALSTDDILEVREALEMKIVGLAAERAQPSDIEAMEETIRALTKPKLTAAEVAEADVAFHSQLALAADNPLFSVLSSSINNVMIEIRLRACRLDGNVVAAERAVFYHSRILERVKAHDVEGARRAMAEHLAEARDTLRRANHSLGNPDSRRKNLG